MDASRAPLSDVIAHLRAAGGRTVELDVLDPDLGRGMYAGEPLDHAGGVYRHRPFRVWVDLAERLGFRLLTPRPLAPPLVRLVFERLDRAARLRPDAGDATEKYGASSEFTRISNALPA